MVETGTGILKKEARMEETERAERKTDHRFIVYFNGFRLPVSVSIMRSYLLITGTVRRTAWLGAKPTD